MLIKEFGSAYADMLERRMAPLYHMSWGNWSLLDIDGTIKDVYACTNPDTGLGRWSYYCNPRIDELFEELKTIDEKKRLKASFEANQIVHDDAPVIFLYAWHDIHGKRTGIPEFKARADNTIDLKWIKGEK